jgi:antitoxin VapB
MTSLPPETEALARRVAERRGKTLEDVLKAAVETEARLAGIVVTEAAKPRRDIDLDRIRAITRRIASQPLLDPRTPREILADAWGRAG